MRTNLFYIYSRTNSKGFSLHFLAPILAVVGVMTIGLTLIDTSRAASNPYTGICTKTIITTTTKVTTTKYKDCILEAQELLDGIQSQNYKSYRTATEHVPYTFTSGNEYYLTINGAYSTATAYAVEHLPGNGTQNELTNGVTNGTWQILCGDAESSGLASNGAAALKKLNFNTSITGEYSLYTYSNTFQAACGSIPTTGSTGSGTTTSTLTPTAADCWGDVVDTHDCYYWVGAYQDYNGSFTATGVSSDFTQAEPQDPVLPEGDNHTLIETYVASADGEQALEFGWYIAADSGKAPVLMVTHWINGAFIGYSTPASPYGFVQVSKTFKPLTTALTVGAVGNFKIQVADNEWQFWYNGAEVGYFPESLWTSQSITFNKIQWVSDYGEVATYVGQLSQVGMGNGILGSLTGSAAVSDYTLYGSTRPADFVGFYEPNGAVTKYYDYGAINTTGFRLGGPGID